ncbi:hypothetical protein [Stappia indica]|uniref:hypothetical protein n=1 Tax=Stappia indica TaxID=538381 RepID=UPI001146143E|nr:hypothetical protein [Stappia indica]
MGADGGHPREPCIWLVQGHGIVNARGWVPHEEFENGGKTPEPILEAMRLTKAGWFLPQDRFPTDNYPLPNSYPSAHEERVPQIFTNGFIFLAGESAEVVQSSDMGEGALYPVRLWHPDRKTLMPGEFFYLSQGNRKDAFLQERSDKEGIDAMSHGRWLVRIVRARPPLLLFSESALRGPDIWWDKSIYKHFFISDRLKRALDQRHLSRDWHLVRCPVVLD